MRPISRHLQRVIFEHPFRNKQNLIKNISKYFIIRELCTQSALQVYNGFTIAACLVSSKCCTGKEAVG